jgi:hypothetical protein
MKSLTRLILFEKHPYFSIPIFLNSIEELQKEEGLVPSALDKVFNEVEDHLINGNLKLVDRILRSIVIEKYAIVILLGFLTVTDPWKVRLKKSGLLERHKLYLETEKRVFNECPPDEVDELLYDLL